jgi:Mg-chelatase subunit ChlD
VPGGRPAAATAAACQQQVALIASSGGKAGVALHPTEDASALQPALDSVQPAGEANLAAALKLALVGWLLQLTSSRGNAGLLVLIGTGLCIAIKCCNFSISILN